MRKRRLVGSGGRGRAGEEERRRLQVSSAGSRANQCSAAQSFIIIAIINIIITIIVTIIITITGVVITAIARIILILIIRICEKPSTVLL